MLLMQQNSCFCVLLFCVKLMPKCQAFIVHYMTLNMRENTHLT